MEAQQHLKFKTNKLGLDVKDLEVQICCRDDNKCFEQQTNGRLCKKDDKTTS